MQNGELGFAKIFFAAKPSHGFAPLRLDNVKMY